MSFFAFVLLVVLFIILFRKVLRLERDVMAQRNTIISISRKLEQCRTLLQSVVKDYKEESEDETKHQEVVPAYQQVAATKQPPYEQTLAPITPEPQQPASAPHKPHPEAPAPSVQPEYQQTIPPVYPQPQQAAAPQSQPQQATTPPPPKKKTSYNEYWVGVSLFNRIGAVLIIIGTIAVAAFEGFHPALRSSILVAFALGVIGLGEIMNRKKPTIVSMGVTATGVALSYVAIATSYFALGTLNMYAALIACIGATILGIYLATRYEAQVIGCLALVGGYLPIFAIDPLDSTMMGGLIVYFVLLSLFSLILALNRKWIAMNIVGYVLTIAGISYVGFLADPIIALAYACFGFLLYTLLPLVSAYRTKQPFCEIETGLILVNTLISSIVIFLIADRLDMSNIHAFLCLAFVAIYWSLAILLKRVFKSSHMATAFVVVSLTFFILFVPFFFEVRWFAIAWLAQGVVLACYGVLVKRPIPEYTGLGLLVLSLVSLLANIDVFIMRQDDILEFTFDYTFFTIGLLIILGCYIIRKVQWRNQGFAIKIIAFTNLWIYGSYMILQHVHGGLTNNYADVLSRNLWAVVTFILVILYFKVRLWADRGTQILANVIHGIGMSVLFTASIEAGTEVYYNGDFFGISINLVMIIIGVYMVIHHHLFEKRNKWTVSYKNISIVYMWGVVLWYVYIFASGFFGVQMILITVTFAVALMITSITAIADKGTKYIAIILNAIGLLWLLMFNSLPYSNVWGLMAMNAVVQIIALFVINYTINLLDPEGKVKPLKLVILSSYFLVVVTQSMMVQGDVAFNNAVISIIYAMAAFVWIIIGFRIRNKPTRTAGLFLTIAAVAKLTVVDTWGLSTEMRIISYISLGIILMLISFVYHKLSKRLDE